mmetsp:Transcript_66384/g.158378  ORF Transcript_66384/g.158378 Transcript_66384/m.158378 type:complete len:332 (-) Transcript_66384:1679-2674(-)
MHGVDQGVLVCGFIPPGQTHGGEVAGEDTSSPHLILHVGHVHRLIWLRLALLMHRQKLHHALSTGLPEEPGVVVQVVPLLHHPAGPGPRGEGGEAPRVHARGVRRDHAPEVPVDHVPHPVGHGVQLVHPGVADEAQGLADVVHVLELLAARQMQGLGGAPCEGVDPVLQQPVGAAKEGHVSDAEAAALLDTHVRGVVAHLHGVELVGVFQPRELVHGLELIQQHPRRCGIWSLVAKPARHSRAQQALPARDDVHLCRGILHAASDVLHRKSAVAKDSTARVLHPAIIPHKRPSLTIAHAIADLPPCSNELILTRVLDDTIDLICTGVVVHH